MKRLALLTFSAVLLSSIAGAQSPSPIVIQDATIVPPSTAQGGSFGQSIDIDGDRMVIGSPFDAPSFFGQGAVYVYERAANGTWVQSAYLTAPTGGTSHGFGWSVSLEGHRLAIGAPGFTGGIANADGAVYVYSFDPSSMNWSLDQQLAAPDSAGAMGMSISLDGDRIATGAPLAEPPPPSTLLNKGCVYIWDRNPGTGVWSLGEKILPVTSSFFNWGDGFGSTLDLDGDRVIIGAPDLALVQSVPPGNPYRHGGAWVFELSTNWQLAATFAGINSNPNAGPQLGLAVAIDGDEVFVAENDTGAMYYDFSAFWPAPTATSTPTSVLTANGMPIQVSSMDVAGDRAVIGGFAVPTGGFAGAYVFEDIGSNGWTLQVLVTPSTATAGFGDVSVAIDEMADYPRYTGSAVPNYAGFEIDGMRCAIGGGLNATLSSEPLAFVVDGPLYRNVAGMSTTTGGVQNLELRSSQSYFNHYFAVLGSATGIHPGTLDTVSGLVLPLTFDTYTLFIIANSGGGFFAPWSGLIDAQGRASSAFILPAPVVMGQYASLIGLTYYHAMTAIDVLGTGQVSLMTNPVAIRFGP